MDCDTTGIEPDLGLVKTKKLVGGRYDVDSQSDGPRALHRVGYSDEESPTLLPMSTSTNRYSVPPTSRPITSAYLPARWETTPSITGGTCA